MADPIKRLVQELARLPGIGEKTAALLVARYGSLAAIMEAAEQCDGAGALGKVKRSLDYLRRAAEVVLISPDIPVPEVDLTRPRSRPIGSPVFSSDCTANRPIARISFGCTSAIWRSR